MKKSHLIIIFIIVLGLIFSAVITYKIKSHANRVAKDEAGRILFSNSKNQAQYTDSQGKSTTLESYKGKVIVVNLWASWSPFATNELPILDKLGDEFKDKELQILAVNRKESPEQAQRFLNSQTTFNNIKIIIDVNDYYYNAVAGYAMPETVVYDKDGVMVKHYQGMITYDDLKAVISELTK